MWERDELRAMLLAGGGYFGCPADGPDRHGWKGVSVGAIEREHEANRLLREHMMSVTIPQGASKATTLLIPVSRNLHLMEACFSSFKKYAKVLGVKVTRKEATAEQKREAGLGSIKSKRYDLFVEVSADAKAAFLAKMRNNHPSAHRIIDNNSTTTTTAVAAAAAAASTITTTTSNHHPLPNNGHLKPAAFTPLPPAPLTATHTNTHHLHTSIPHYPRALYRARPTPTPPTTTATTDLTNTHIHTIGTTTARASINTSFAVADKSDISMARGWSDGGRGLKRAADDREGDVDLIHRAKAVRVAL